MPKLQPPSHCPTCGARTLFDEGRMHVSWQQTGFEITVPMLCPVCPVELVAALVFVSGDRLAHWVVSRYGLETLVPSA